MPLQHEFPDDPMPCAMWLRCEIVEGQFDREYAVGGDTPDGAGFSLFAPAQFVHVDQPVGKTPVPGWVRVEMLDRDGEHVLVRLPRPTMTNGRTVTVRSGDLEVEPNCQDA